MKFYKNKMTFRADELTGMLPTLIFLLLTAPLLVAAQGKTAFQPCGDGNCEIARSTAGLLVVNFGSATDDLVPALSPVVRDLVRAGNQFSDTDSPLWTCRRLARALGICTISFRA